MICHGLEAFSDAAAGVEVASHEEQQEGGEYDEEYNISNRRTCLEDVSDVAAMRLCGEILTSDHHQLPP